MAKKLTMEDTLSTLSKLSIKDKIVLITTAAVFVFVCMMFFFKLITGQYEDVSNLFPESTLADNPLYQSYQFKRSDDLTVPIKFPTIPYGMFVNGEEICVREDGCSFSYSDNVDIVVVEVQNGVETDSIIKDKLYMYLFDDTANTKVKYKAAIVDNGFMNGLYATYECGVYTVAGKERYILSYRYYTGAEKDILFMTVTEDDLWFLSLKNLLDKMFYTMYTYDSEDGSVFVLENLNQEPTLEKEVEIETEDIEEEIIEEEAEDALSTYVEYEGPISEKAKSQLEKIRILREEKSQKSEEGYLRGEENTEFYVSYDYENTLTNAYFIFHYSEVYKIPGYAYLYDPEGIEYEPLSVNDSLSGDIIFEIEDPAQGQWSFVIEDESGLGRCTVDSMEASAYEALQQPFKEEERTAPPVD